MVIAYDQGKYEFVIGVYSGFDYDSVNWKLYLPKLGVTLEYKYVGDMTKDIIDAHNELIEFMSSIY